MQERTIKRVQCTLCICSSVETPVEHLFFFFFFFILFLECISVCEAVRFADFNSFLIQMTFRVLLLRLLFIQCALCRFIDLFFILKFKLHFIHVAAILFTYMTFCDLFCFSLLVFISLFCVIAYYLPIYFTLC